MKKKKTNAAVNMTMDPCNQDATKDQNILDNYLSIPEGSRRTSHFKRCLAVILESPDRTFVRDLIMEPRWRDEWLTSDRDRDPLMMGRQEVLVHAVTNCGHAVRMEVYLLLKDLVLEGELSYMELAHLRWMITSLARCDRRIGENLASWSDILAGDSMR